MERLTYDLTKGRYVDDPYADDSYVVDTIRAGLELATSTRETGDLPVSDKNPAAPGHQAAEEVLAGIRRRICLELGSEMPDWAQMAVECVHAVGIAHRVKDRDLTGLNQAAYRELARLRDRLAEIERALYPAQTINAAPEGWNGHPDIRNLEEARARCTCSVLHEGEGGPLSPVEDCPVHGVIRDVQPEERRQYPGRARGLAPDDPYASGYSPHPSA